MKRTGHISITFASKSFKLVETCTLPAMRTVRQ